MNKLSKDDIAEITASIQQLTPVNAVAAKLPRFWATSPEVWFRQVESIFEVHKPKPITDQKAKFNYVLSTLDSTASDKVQSLILQPSALAPYEDLKT